MKHLLVWVILAGSCFAQKSDFASGNGPAGNVVFWTVSAATVGATLFDDYQTMQGTRRHICAETNFGGGFPSARRVYGESLAVTGAVIGVSYLFKRLRLPVVPYAPTGIAIYKHVHGGLAWYGTGCLD